jgi:hypothetical protein
LKFLVLDSAVARTLYLPISDILLQSSKPTEATMKQTIQLSDYITLLEEEVLTYQASDMELEAHNDKSFLNKPK